MVKSTEKKSPCGVTQGPEFFQSNLPKVCFHFQRLVDISKVKLVRSRVFRISTGLFGSKDSGSLNKLLDFSEQVFSGSLDFRTTTYYDAVDKVCWFNRVDLSAILDWTLDFRTSYKLLLIVYQISKPKIYINPLST